MKKTLKRLFIGCLTLLPLVTSGNVLAEEANSTFIPRPARPSDLIQRAEETSNEENDQTADNENDAPDEADLSNEAQDTSNEETTEVEDMSLEDYLEDPFRIYSVYQFANQEDADYLLDWIEEDPHSQGQFDYYHNEAVQDLVEYRFSYADTAKEEQRPLFIYADSNLKTTKAAEDFIEQQLNLFPDLFVTGDVVEVDENTYHIALVLKIGIDAENIFFNNLTNLMEYTGERQPYTYTLEEGQDDTIQSTIKEIFPNSYEFTQEETEDGVAVTMTPINNAFENGNPVSTQELTGWRRTLNDWVSPFGLNYQQVIAGIAIILAIIGLLFILIK